MQLSIISESYAQVRDLNEVVVGGRFGFGCFFFFIVGNSSSFLLLEF